MLNKQELLAELNNCNVLINQNESLKSRVSNDIEKLQNILNDAEKLIMEYHLKIGNNNEQFNKISNLIVNPTIKEVYHKEINGVSIFNLINKIKIEDKKIDNKLKQRLSELEMDKEKVISLINSSKHEIKMIQNLIDSAELRKKYITQLLVTI